MKRRMADSKEIQRSRSATYNLRPQPSKIEKQVIETKVVPKPRITKKKTQKPKSNVRKGYRIMVPQRPKAREYSSSNPCQQQSRSDNEVFCSICLDTENHPTNRQLFCGHVFHSKCINNWLSFRFSCPVCRVPADELSVRHLSRFRQFSENLARWLFQSARFNNRFRS
ncbi:RING-type domain-containing protein [Trichonephila clavata]|uniref:RING-type E3 ubiquitin transferase n=1 Tax=Trichonephila clavata TaxID=2740835 RepID=A0A8X6L876_TRICU|nr:RING-type domain-containing protein [Trichonephila clavata]